MVNHHENPPFERISGGRFSKHLANLSDCFAMKLTPRASFPLIAHSIIQVNFASNMVFRTTLLGPWDVFSHLFGMKSEGRFLMPLNCY